MALCTYFLLAATVVCCFTTLIALPMDGFATKNKCQCLKTKTSVIPSRLFQRIEILPPSAHCHKTEILITKKDNQTICVDPKARWINIVLSKVMSKRAERETAVPTVA